MLDLSIKTDREVSEALDRWRADRMEASFPLQCMLATVLWRVLHEDFPDLRAKLEAAERERDEATSRLDAMKNPATLRSMNYRPGQPMTFDVEHPIVSIMAAHLAEAVGTAENYIETEMTHEDGRAFVFMIRRKHGKTPHSLRREAEARAETAEQERDEARRLGVIEARNAVANISMLISERDAQKVRAEAAEQANLGLRKRVHQLDLHNQHFERCESRWCHPKKSSFAELDDPAIEFARNTTFLNQDLDTWNTRLTAAEQRNRELEALVRKLLKSAVPHPTEHPTMWAAWKEAEAALASGEPTISPRDARQKQIHDWCVAAFGADHAASIPQRGIRHAEEAIEAAQAAGCDAAMVHKLVDHVYSNEPGKLHQEIGGSGICPTCSGSKRTWKRQSEDADHMHETDVPCPDCAGKRDAGAPEEKEPKA